MDRGAWWAAVYGVGHDGSDLASVGFRTCRERGALGGTPGFQTLETLESSSLGSGGKVGEGC